MRRMSRPMDWARSMTWASMVWRGIQVEYRKAVELAR
jgi:hypothetical protein